MPVTIICIILILLAAYLSYRTRKLTGAGAITGACIAIAIYMGTGQTGIALLAMFFVLAALATAHRKQEKGLEHSQRRDAMQVLANGGLAGLSGLLAYFMPGNAALALLIIAAALASATADTLSSELGIFYGKRFYDITNFKPAEKGQDGVISLEGTLIGIVGSVVIAIVYAIGVGFNNIFFAIIIAGTIGNIADSVLGATLERKGIIRNNEVNFLNTFIAAFVCCQLLYLNLL
jgi:uncharacterized protein (TIGR00297 family)